MSNEFYSKFTKVYRELSSFLTIKKQVAEFKHSHTRLKNDAHEECPKNTTSEITEQIHNLILDDRWIKVYEIAEAWTFQRMCSLCFA